MLTRTAQVADLAFTNAKACKEYGIQNVLALRGDAPRGKEYWVASDAQFQHGRDLVRYIREHHGDYFCIGVAGYPEGHCDSSDKQSDTQHLVAKQTAGADFIITQLFYDTDAYIRWQDDVRQSGVTIPILPGIMPIQTFGGFSRMTHMCKTFIPDKVLESLDPIKGDDAAVKDYGVTLAAEMIQELWKKGGVRGFHFCTLNLEKSVHRILDELGWSEDKRRIAATTKKAASVNGKINGHVSDPQLGALLNTDTTTSRRRTDSATSWDEYPNGRFGDARSPAYGDLDGWGVSLKLTPSEALRNWGTPVQHSDISEIFVRYLQRSLSAIPWSEEPLRSETNSILPHLIALNLQKNWWTVGSQPAVDGCPSEDDIHGFGPEGGYVYQKAFVEFFGDYEDVLWIQRKALDVERSSKRRKVTFYAANAETESGKALVTNMQKGDGNAVTWGIFPGKEIVTTTLIEEMSFIAWKVSCLQLHSANDLAKAYSCHNAGRSLFDICRMGASVPAADAYKGIAPDITRNKMAHQCSAS